MIKKHFVPHSGKQSQFFAPILNCFPLLTRNVSIAPSRGRQMFFLVQPSPFTRHLALLINNEHSLTLPQVSMVVLLYCSDFVTNSYGELSCEKSRVPVKKKKWVWNWKYLGVYVTRQLIWRQTPKLCITVYWNYNIVLLF